MQQHKATRWKILLGLLIAASPWLIPRAAAQSACEPGRDLLTIPEIKSKNGVLKAEIKLTSGKRTLWGLLGDNRCASQDLRYFTGRDLSDPPKPGAEDPFAKGEPIPGPTLRAKVGDLIEIKFLNQVDTQAFANSLDQSTSNATNTTGCDEVYTEGKQLYPGTQGDTYPNCLHGSSTSNLHFHGTHTTPGTTGDNVLLFVRPALRSPDHQIIGPTEALVDKAFAQIFSACEKDGTPTMWDDLPADWREDQERLIKQYDTTTPYKGGPATLPKDMQLWPENEKQIEEHVWPQYQIGAYPYCFRLTDKNKQNEMGQAPGTHWYHAHKHGSTALNVANGMTGAFVIEGQYDADLRKFYGEGFRDQVLVIQQLSSTPFPVLNPARKGRDPTLRPLLSVNGRQRPVVKMRPGEVQLWRLVNGAFRDAVQLQNFAPQGDASPGGLAWRQIAQDGVQLHYDNYLTLGATNRMINLAPANRADLLVKAPVKPGKYDLLVQPNEGLYNDDKNLQPSPQTTLLTVSVEGQPVEKPQDFIQAKEDFPVLPGYLADLPATDIRVHREVTFGATHNMIDGKEFDQTKYSQIMALDSVEEWKISNQANDKAHPFHIHINPFQITEVFEPNAPDTNTLYPDKPCYVDPMNPGTWKPCTPIPAPYVWWDTFAIPMGKNYDVTAACTNNGKTEKNLCPTAIQPYVTCGTNNAKNLVCTETIPGYFKMRSKFADFTGAYVLHCHILIHEDRGMMQMVEVVPISPLYEHH
jgi:FtsP/CotA-like multicopper oxidase with cupredoxin domain